MTEDRNGCTLRSFFRYFSSSKANLDLDDNCHPPDGYFGNGVCTVHAYGHDVADRWLLKDDTEANEVMESGNELHSVIVLAAKVRQK